MTAHEGPITPGLNPAISIILPVDSPNSKGHILTKIVGEYVAVLETFEQRWEIQLVLVDHSKLQTACKQIASAHPCVRLCVSSGGWGAAVLAGLRASEGELLCYTSYERTSTAVLSEMLRFALRNPEVVLRANRRTRDTRLQRLGSLLFNLECRVLLGISTWDVNGTPKVFSRAFSRLLELKAEDDMFDVEFTLICEREKYPVIEIPIDAELGLRSRPDYRAALRMYLGVLGMRSHAAGR